MGTRGSYISFWIYTEVRMVSFVGVKDMWSRSRVTWSRVELLQSRRELTTKVRKQP